MNTAAGVVGGLIVGAALGFGVATQQHGGHMGSSQPSAQSAGSDGPLLELDGTKFKEADLPSDVRASLYEVEEENHQRMDGILSQFALQLSLAKDKDKNAKPEALPPFDQLVQAPAPTDDEMKQVFEQNKARLPPDTAFEKIKPEIERYLKNQKMAELLRSKNEELRAKNRLVLLIPTPVAPKVELDIAPYPAKGAPTIANTLVEAADYVCPHCQAMQPDVEAALKDLGDKIRYVPVSFSLHPEGVSGTLARGAFCARQQGDESFWKYHNTAFSTAQAKAWKASDPDNKDAAMEVAGTAGLDKAKFEGCLNTPEAQAFVTKTDESMHKAGVSGTPTFFLNGRKLALTAGKSLKESIQAQLAPASH